MKRLASYFRNPRKLFPICVLFTISFPLYARTGFSMNDISLLAGARPWCIGRLLMDRPAKAELSGENYEYWGAKIDVVSGVTSIAFKNRMDNREDELSIKKRTVLIPYKESIRRGLKNGVVETDTSWLEHAVSPTPNSRLFIFNEDAETDALFNSEGYVLAGKTMLSMKSMLRATDIQKSIQLTTDEYRYISYRDDWSVPAERGFCIKGALIGGPSRNSEAVEQYFILEPGRPSMFSIKMRDAVDVDRQSSLLSDLPGLREKLRAQGYSHNVRILREGRRQIAGMDAEEVLFSIREGDVQLFRFFLLAPGIALSMAQPHTEIQLNFGSEPYDDLPPNEATSPVDEAGAVRVWDTLLNSLRLRPGAM
jgi:hypothetical protein